MEPIIKVDNVSMCFNLSKEKHELSLIHISEPTRH